MTALIQLTISTTLTTVLANSIGLVNDYRALIIIAIINAIVIPIINFLGKKLETFLKKYGATDTQILMIELSSKKEVIRGLKTLLNNDISDILKEDLKRRIIKLEKEISDIRRELDVRT